MKLPAPVPSLSSVLLLCVPWALVTACGPPDRGSDEAGGAGGGAVGRGGTPEGAGSKVTGTLVVPLSDSPEHLNPGVTTQGGVHAAARSLYSGLVSLDADLHPVPDLAASWKVEDGGATYRFRLREGVEWHDGEPFTSADVAYTFEEVLLKYHARARASLGTVLEAVETPGPHEVVFRFREPYAPFLQQLNVHEAAILPRHLFEGTDPLTNPANRAPVGTGPFRFVSHDPDVELRYEAHPRYHHPGLPRARRLVMPVIPDGGNQVLALEAGTVDYLQGVPGPDEARLERKGFPLFSSPLGAGGSNCIMTLSFNLDRPLFRDVRVRRAIAHAIDRRGFLERVLFGQGRVAEAPISSGIPFAHAEGLPMPEHDREEARRLLEEAGWHVGADGIRISTGPRGVGDRMPLRIRFHHFPAFTPYADLLRAQLRRVGIEVLPRPMDPPLFVEEVFRDRDFDTNIVSYCNMTDPEIGVRRMYVSSNIAPVPFSNSSGYSDPRVDSLFDAGRRTLDRSARGDIYREIQEILVRDLPYFWLVETASTRAHRPECSGFGVYGHFAERASCEP